MKKIIIILTYITIFIIFPGGITAFAEENSDHISEYEQQVNEALESAMDEDTREFIGESTENGGLSGFSPEGIIKEFLEEISVSLTEPLRIFGRLTAVLILTALVRSMAEGALSGGYTVISLLACMTVIYRTVYGAFSAVCDHLDKLAGFMLAYIPVYTSVTAAAGNFAAGSGYYASLLGVCELIGFVSRSVLMPFLSLFIALSFTAAINPDMHFSNAAESLKNAVRLTLTSLMTLFTGTLSVRSISGAAADSAAARAVRFGASSFIPIIGGSVSEAYSTVNASIGVIRTSVGTVGIAAVTFMLLRPLAVLLLAKATLDLARIVSDMLGLSEPSELLRSTSYALSAAVSTVLCFSMMFIISTAVLMLTAANVQ